MTQTDLELYEIRQRRGILEKMLKSLGDREREINDHKRAADIITADRRLLNADVQRLLPVSSGVG